ncbi:MAG: T7SS effector LXG polymorphic toxin [Hespellia sp.]|nr:T7SS effector LXG polymorphic toxin [Hespellia sp.]
MGLKLYPGNVRTQCTGMNQTLQKDNQTLQLVLGQISQFVGNTALQGAAWTSMKTQLSNHEAVIQGLICANEAMISDNESLAGQVGDEELIEDKLNDSITQLQNANDSLQRSIDNCQRLMRNPILFAESMYGLQLCINRYQNSINNNNELIRELQDKLQKLYDIEAGTSGLYSGANALYAAVTSGVNAIKCGWSGGAFVSFQGSNDWRSFINKSWKQSRYAIDKKIEEYFGVKVTYQEALEFQMQFEKLIKAVQTDPTNIGNIQAIL